jgi:dihydrofolate reductase
VFTFVSDGVESAIDRAKKAAADRDVLLFGATVMQQALPLGLVNEVRLHVNAVLLGGGTSLFGALQQAVELERISVLVTPAATHLNFRVLR